MANPRIQVLSDEFTLKRSALTALDTLAANEKRDLNESEQAEYDATVTRMETIEGALAKLNKDADRFDAVAETVTRSIPSAARTTPRVETIPFGEQMLIRAKHSLGGRHAEAVADEFETLQRVLAHGTSADQGAVVPTVEGDLIAFVDASRNAVNSARRFPMPDNHASTFLRPRIATFTSVAAQGAQGSVLSSTAPVVAKDTITKVTYGGTISLSEQEIDWTSPEMLGVTVQDLARQYGIVTDDVLCTAIETASTASVQTVVSLTATLAQFTTAVAAAASTAYGTAKKLPDTLYVAPDRFFYLAGLADTTGRAAFPVYNPTNAVGANPSGIGGWSGMTVLGLKVVVDPNFTANLWTVAVSDYVEWYEQVKGLLQIAAPSTLETTIAYRGYAAANVYTQGFGAMETV